MKQVAFTLLLVLCFIPCFAVPGPITGTTSICTGATTTLSDATPGGSWTSSNPAVANIDPFSGLLTGVSGGLATITYTVGPDYVTTSVTIDPFAYSVTGGGSFCASAAGVHISLAGSDVGVSYILYHGVAPVDTLAGTGAALDYGLITVAGTYTIMGINSTSSCSGHMAGSATVVVNPLPNVYNVTGGGYYCVGGAGQPVGLSSSDTGISYQLYVGSSLSGSPLNGTGTNLDFGLHTISGAYTVVASNTLTGCHNNMTGGIAIITSPNPIPYSLTGGGTMCLNDAGFTFTLSASNVGIRYQLYRGSTPVDTPVDGVGASIVFGRQAGAGIYKVIAMDTISGCISAMIDSDTINVLPLPNLYTVTGGGSYCYRGDGPPVGLSNSDTGFRYQLLYAGSLYGAPVNGTGHPLDFGLHPAPGYYTVSAINNTTGCHDTMSGAVFINAIPLPDPITGDTNICVGHVNLLSDVSPGGTWSSSNVTVASVGSSTGLANGIAYGTCIITYTVSSGCMVTTTVHVNHIPGPITGPSTFCSTVPTPLFNVVPGGIWISNNTSIANVDSVTGFVSGVTAGTTIITYSLGAGCIAIHTVSLLPGPPPVTGNVSVCIGGTSTLADAASGGDWSSSNTSIATISSTGDVNSVSIGTATITYQILSGCPALATFAVNPYPSIITGNHNICQGLNSTLSDTLTGGTWYSPSTLLGIDSLTGVASGLTPGTATITYTLPSGCATTTEVTILPGTAPITGSPLLCNTSTSTFTDITSGGVWTSSNTSIATVGSSSGTVTGASAGTATISYTSGTTGCASILTLTVYPLPTLFHTTGGGSICTGGAGLPVNLSGSENSCTYQLYVGLTSLGSPIGGTGGPLAFGLQSFPGNYTIISRNSATGCTLVMADSANIGVFPLPSYYPIEGGGRYCIGSAGVDIGLAGSQRGVLYQLTLGGTAIGSPFHGTGSTIDFGLYTSAGTYKVSASDSISGCSNNFIDSATIVSFPSDSTSVSLVSSVGDTLCKSENVIFTAIPYNGGIRPYYQWLVNGVNMGIDSANFHYNPASGSVITVLMSSSKPCPVPATVLASKTMIVDTMGIPFVSLTVSPGTFIQRGTSDTFVAHVLNGGLYPRYQWYVNRRAVAGANGPTYISDTLKNQDSISCYVTGSGICGLPSFNGVLMRVSPVGVQSNNMLMANFNLFPNPNKGEFTITGDTDDQELSLEISDMPGRIIYQTKLLPAGGRINERIQLNNGLSSGMYLVTLHSALGQKVFRMEIGD